MKSSIASAFEEYLTSLWGTKVMVAEMAESSGGARRTNLLCQVRTSSEVIRLCLTLVSDQDSSRSVQAEAAVRAIAEGAGIPTPHILVVCEDPSPLGAPFILSDWIEGETIPRRVLRVATEFRIRDKVAEQLARSFAALHRLDVRAAPSSLPSYAEADPALIALDEVNRRLTALPGSYPTLALGLRWLEGRLPSPPTIRSIVHGDLRNGNVIVDGDGLRAVLDWEKCTSGDDPMKDLAWFALRTWRFGFDAFEMGGFSTRNSFVKVYTDHGGTFDEKRFEWWKVAQNLLWATGLARMSEGYLSGSSRSLVSAASGRRVSEIEWDVLMLTAPKTTELSDSSPIAPSQEFAGSNVGGQKGCK